ncbi:unnamed protein product, partial [Medioppia subpectinata]
MVPTDKPEAAIQMLKGTGVTAYMNTDTVRRALHVRQGSKRWSTIGGPYDPIHYMTPQADTVQQLINTYKIPKLIVYNGDFDSVCNFIGDQRFVDSLGFKTAGHYREWTVDGSSDGVIGGFVQNYEKGLSFVVVRGAGHMVPTDKPEAAIQILKGEWTVNGTSDGVIGGFIQNYEKGLSFVVVRGAGHMVPTDKPEAAIQMLK